MNPMRPALLEARDALQMARDQSYCEMYLTGEQIRQCEMAIQSLHRAVAADDADDDEANAQRARDKCLGEFGYDISRLHSTRTPKGDA